MEVDIRQYTRVIIRKNTEYLQCMSGVINSLVWNNSPYHAWWTRDMNKAREVARVTGGIPMLFNPVVGKVAACRG